MTVVCVAVLPRPPERSVWLAVTGRDKYNSVVDDSSVCSSAPETTREVGLASSDWP